VSNPSQTDSDGDGVGDDCDNCPSTPNADQLDSDGDLAGDVCDACPNDPFNDSDGDGLCADVDNCPNVFNPGQEDTNMDGIGDVCQPALIDTIASTCTRLHVSSRGNFGGGGKNGASLDYFGSPNFDCEPIYLYEGTPMVLDNSGGTPDLFLDAYGNTTFKLPAFAGKDPVAVLNTGIFEIFEGGTVVTNNDAIAMEKTWYAPLQSDSCNFMIQCMKFYSGDGGTHTNISLGEFIDWDVPSTSGANNNGGFSSSSKLVYQSGTGTNCQNNTNRFGGMALLAVGSEAGCADTAATLRNGIVESNPAYVYPTGRPEATDFVGLMSQTGYTAIGTTTDLFSLITYVYDTTITPSDTMYIYTVVASEFSGSSTDLETTVAKARQWLLDHVATQCVTTCCIGIRGNVNGDGAESIDIADLTFLVNYMFKSGPTPTCVEEANVDGIGGLDIADLTYLVSYMFKSGPDPVACP
jgi:hypothetical protein